MTAKPLLLLIDAQRGFDEPTWPKRWNDDFDRNGKALLEAWRKSRLPIIHVRHDSIEPRSSLRPGQSGNGFRAGFEPLAPEPVISKSVNSAFIGTDLDLQLRRLNPSRVLVFGISTDMCVSTTVRMGANLGWPITLIPDACDCFDLPGDNGRTIPARQIHDAHVASLRYDFCDTLSTEAALSVAKREGQLPVEALV